MACPYFDPEPVLFIDVDGVLSPVDPVFDDPGEWFAVRLGGARCWGSTVLGAWLHYLHDRGAVIVWATSLVEFPEALERYAAAIGAPPGLDTIAAQPHLAAAELDGAGTRWGVERWLNERSYRARSRPMVWVDDALSCADVTFAQRRSIAVFRPNSRVGLGREGVRGRVERALDGRPTLTTAI